jgi:hypothetical protein
LQPSPKNNAQVKGWCLDFWQVESTSHVFKVGCVGWLTCLQALQTRGWKAYLHYAFSRASVYGSTVGLSRASLCRGRLMNSPRRSQLPWRVPLLPRLIVSCVQSFDMSALMFDGQTSGCSTWPLSLLMGPSTSTFGHGRSNRAVTQSECCARKFMSCTGPLTTHPTQSQPFDSLTHSLTHSRS